MNQIEFRLFEKNDKDGNKFFVAAPNFPISVNLEDVFFVIFPEQEFPKMFMKSTSPINPPKKSIDE